MFTGLIEEICEVQGIRTMPAGRGSRLHLALGSLVEDSRLGDSIAINGVCLTVVELQGQYAWFDVSPETLNRSTLGSLRIGDQVNAERALRVGDRLGGHFVQGHVDGIGTVQTLQKTGAFWDIHFRIESELLMQMVPKGSVAVDGISLTIACLDNRGFSVAVIPETAQHTTLRNRRAGDPVNIETDLLIKAAQRTCKNWVEQNQSLTVDKLRESGF